MAAFEDFRSPHALSARAAFDEAMAAAFELDARDLRRLGLFDSARFAAEAAHAYRSGWGHLVGAMFRGLVDRKGLAGYASRLAATFAGLIPTNPEGDEP